MFSSSLSWYKPLCFQPSIVPVTHTAFFPHTKTMTTLNVLSLNFIYNRSLQTGTSLVRCLRGSGVDELGAVFGHQVDQSWNKPMSRCRACSLLTVLSKHSHTSAWVGVKNFGFTEEQKNIEQGSIKLKELHVCIMRVQKKMAAWRSEVP